MKERRRFIRFKIPLRIEFTIDVKMGFLYRGEMVDFSREGLRISVSSFTFHKKDSIKLKAYLPQRPTPIFFVSKIRWIKVNEERCEVGLSIEDISSVDKSEILAYAYKLWRENINGESK